MLGNVCMQFCCLALEDYRPSSCSYCYYCVSLLNCVHCEITACDSDNKQSLILSYLNTTFLIFAVLVL